MSQARELAAAFLACLNRRDTAGALALLDPAGRFEMVPAGIHGTAGVEGARFLHELVAAFPDLLIQTRALSGGAGMAVAEIKLEGTQAAHFLGVLNQEKHLDLDQAWMFSVGEGRIAGVRAYWCQNQLYRRLAVKRLDRISILA